MVLYPNKLPESERVCSGICNLAKSYLIYIRHSIYESMNDTVLNTVQNFV